MGARSFFVTKAGIYKNAQQAFVEAVEEHYDEYGDAGYTGTIPEKDTFIMVEVPPRKDPTKFAKECLNTEDRFWDNKWGPAGCVEVKGSYLKKMRGEIWKGKRNFKAFHFFGWASE